MVPFGMGLINDQHRKRCYIRRNGKPDGDFVGIRSAVSPHRSLLGENPNRLVVCHCAFAFCFSFDKGNTIECQFSGRTYECAANSCAQVGFVRSQHTYSSDCYVIGKPSTDGHSKSPKWYQLNLPNGKHSYVNDFYCDGQVPRC